MIIRIGDPLYLGFQPADGVDPGNIYSVGVSKEANSGQLLATGTVTVVVATDQGYDDATMLTMAKQEALAMIAADPDLLTPVHLAPNGPRNPTRADGTPAPWEDGGFIDPPDGEPKTGEPRRIMSPDTPATGQ